MLPFESVDVVGIRIATGVVGIVAIGDGEGVMMMLFDAGGGFFPSGALNGEGLMTMLSAADAGEVVTTGSSALADSSAHGERMWSWSGIKADEVVSSARDGNVAGGTFGMPTLVGIFLSVLSAAASVDDDPSSDSVDVDVAVRYNAVCNADAASTAFSVGSQFQTPRYGKRPSTTPAVPIQSAPHASPPKLVKVQPLGSSIILTPVA